MSKQFDFSKAQEQTTFSIIPEGTLAKIRMTIIPGYHNDDSKGWTDGFVTLGTTGAAYLKAKFEILDGEFKGRFVSSLIGMHSPKGPIYEAMGQTFIRSALESAKDIHPKDTSSNAVEAKKANLKDLDGLVFAVKISVAKDLKGNDRNEVKTVITPSHPRYYEFMPKQNSFQASVSNEVIDDSVPSFK